MCDVITLKPFKRKTFAGCKRLNVSCAARCGLPSDYFDHLFSVAALRHLGVGIENHWTAHRRLSIGLVARTRNINRKQIASEAVLKCCAIVGYSTCYHITVCSSRVCWWKSFCVTVCLSRVYVRVGYVFRLSGQWLMIKSAAGLQVFSLSSPTSTCTHWFRCRNSSRIPEAVSIAERCNKWSNMLTKGSHVVPLLRTEWSLSPNAVIPCTPQLMQLLIFLLRCTQ